MRILKEILIILLKLIVISAILAAIGAVIAYIVSVRYDIKFPKALEYAGIVLIVSGLLSVIGNRKILTNYSYNMTKFSTDVQKSTYSDIKMKFDSYKFFILTGFAGVILFLISLAIWEY